MHISDSRTFSMTCYHVCNQIAAIFRVLLTMYTDSCTIGLHSADTLASAVAVASATADQKASRLSDNCIADAVSHHYRSRCRNRLSNPSTTILAPSYLLLANDLRELMATSGRALSAVRHRQTTAAKRMHMRHCSHARFSPH